MKNSPKVDSPKSPDVMDVRGIAEVLNLDPADLSYLEGQVRRKEVEGEVLRPGTLLELLGRRWNLIPFSRAFAEKLDQLNNFDYRDQFTLPRKGMLPNEYGKSKNAEDKETIYLCSHSMGLKPKALDGYIHGMLENWGDWGVLTQFHGQFPGKDIEVLPRPLMNKVVGAKDNETALMNGLSVNIHLLMVHFYQPTNERFKILIEEHAFPSDMYIAKSQLRLHGISEEDGLVFIKSREGELCIREEDIYDVIQREGSQIACLLLPGVQYLTGQYFNIEKITKWAHEKGCIVGWDLAHAVCNIPMKLHDWNVDFACWCTYKYMCGGQGCHAGIFVHENMWGHHGPKLEGWWGTNDQERFKMKSYIEPALGADSFRISNPSAWATVPVYAALEVFSQVDWKRFRHKQFWLTGFMEYLVKSVNAQLMKDFPEKYESQNTTPIRIVTPEDTESRGCQLSLIISGDDTTRFSEALLEAGVICDFRYPDRIRATPSPMYTRYEEVWRFGELLYELLGGCKRPGNTAGDTEATSCSIH